MWKRENRSETKRIKGKKRYKRKNYDSVLFIPSTPNSELRKAYQQVIRNSGISICVVEKSGRTLKSLLQKSDPFGEKKCSREECLVCGKGGKGPCTSEGITYDLICEDGCAVNGVYRGESSNNAYTRGLEHQRAYVAGDRKSPMIRHMNEKHGGVKKSYKMNVTATFGKDSMKRQIAESIDIENTIPERLINTRCEWNKPKVPRIRIIV